MPRVAIAVLVVIFFAGWAITTAFVADITSFLTDRAGTTTVIVGGLVFCALVTCWAHRFFGPEDDALLSEARGNWWQDWRERQRLNKRRERRYAKRLRRRERRSRSS